MQFSSRYIPMDKITKELHLITGSDLIKNKMIPKRDKETAITNPMIIAINGIGFNNPFSVNPMR